MKNVIVASFCDESKTYEALSKLKRRTGMSEVISAGIIKQQNGNVQIMDGFHKYNYGSGWLSGTLIGTMVGILGGPIGMLLGMSIGSLVGVSVDAGKMQNDNSTINHTVAHLSNYECILFILAEETSNNELDAFINQFNPTEVVRKSYVEVQAEVEHAQELQKTMAKEAKNKLHEENKDKFLDSAKEKEQELEAKIKKMEEEAKEKMHDLVK